MTLSQEIGQHLEELTRGFTPVFRAYPKFYNHVIQLVEKPLIINALCFTRGNVTRAARILGLNRNTLANKIMYLNIKIERMREVNGWYLTGRPDGQKVRGPMVKVRFPSGCR